MTSSIFPPLPQSSPSRKPRRVLAVRGGALGDFILTLPALKLLGGQGAELELLTRPVHARLAMDFGWAAGWRALDSPEAAALHSATAELPGGWRDWLGTFDAVVSWMPDPGGIFQSRIRQCGVVEFVQADSRCGLPEPASRQLARSAFPNLNSGLPPFDLFEHRPASASINPRLIAFHPGSGSLSKNWPWENWLEVVRYLHQRRPGTHWLLVAGEVEEDGLEAMTTAFNELGIPWQAAFNLELTDLARRLRECGLFLGHDTGISHLAAACGVPCRLLFGPTPPQVWAPVGNGIQVLAAPGANLENLPTAMVIQWLDPSI